MPCWVLRDFAGADDDLLDASLRRLLEARKKPLTLITQRESFARPVRMNHQPAAAQANRLGVRGKRAPNELRPLVLHGP